MADNFSPKFTTENEVFTFEWAYVLSTSETISTATTTISVIAGTDASASSMLSGSTVISGTKTLQRVTGGVAGVDYRLITTITTSDSNTYVAVGDFSVVSTLKV